MSLKGTLRQLLPLKGKATELTPKLNGTLEPVDRLSGELTAKGSFSGVLSQVGKNLGIVANKLLVLYRFLSASDSIITRHKARADAAPAKEITAESAIQTSVEAPAKAQPAKAVTVDSKAYASVVARLVAYNRAALQYIKGIAMAHSVKPVSAPGAVGRYIKAVKLGRVSKAEAAPGTIAESRYNVQNVGVKAAAEKAPAVDSPVFEREMPVEVTAKAGKATTIATTINPFIGVTCTARPYCWFMPEQDGDTLTIYQALFSGIQNGDTLEIDMEDESAYWANATVDGDTLNLVFVASATQTDDELELI